MNKKPISDRIKKDQSKSSISQSATNRNKAYGRANVHAEHTQTSTIKGPQWVIENQYSVQAAKPTACCLLFICAIGHCGQMMLELYKQFDNSLVNTIASASMRIFLRMGIFFEQGWTVPCWRKKTKVANYFQLFIATKFRSKI